MTAGYPEHVPRSLKRAAENLWGEDDAPLMAGIILRLLRFLIGDPSAPILVTSTGTANVQQLPDNTPALSAVIQVVGNPVAYTLDQTTPVPGTSPQIPVGAVVTLTGQPTLKAFKFVSAVAANATVAGSFYT